MALQVRRTPTPDNSPTGLVPGQLSVEMGSDPPRLWCGVPASIDATERREIGGTSVLPVALLGGQAFLRGHRLTATSYRFSVRDLIVRDADDRGIVLQGSAGIDCDVDVIGVNGRDQAAALPIPSWVQFYWIYDSDNDTLATIASTELPADGGPTLPAGFTHFAYIGPIRSLAAGLLDVRINGRSFFYMNPFQQTIIASSWWSGIEGVISTANFVPPNADEFVLFVYLSHGVGTWFEGRLEVRLRTGVTTFMLYLVAGQYFSGQATLPNIDQQFRAVCVGGATANMFINGYRVANGAI
jgi:hypothetical protein